MPAASGRYHVYRLSEERFDWVLDGGNPGDCSFSTVNNGNISVKIRNPRRFGPLGAILGSGIRRSGGSAVCGSQVRYSPGSRFAKIRGSFTGYLSEPRFEPEPGNIPHKLKTTILYAEDTAFLAYHQFCRHDSSSSGRPGYPLHAQHLAGERTNPAFFRTINSSSGLPGACNTLLVTMWPTATWSPREGRWIFWALTRRLGSWKEIMCYAATWTSKRSALACAWAVALSDQYLPASCASMRLWTIQNHASARLAGQRQFIYQERTSVGYRPVQLPEGPGTAVDVTPIYHRHAKLLVAGAASPERTTCGCNRQRYLPAGAERRLLRQFRRLLKYDGFDNWRWLSPWKSIWPTISV